MTTRLATALAMFATFALIGCDDPAPEPEAHASTPTPVAPTPEPEPVRAPEHEATPKPARVNPPLARERRKMKKPLTGQITREQVLALPRWAKAFEGATASPESAKLAAVAPGAQVYVILGTWCSDSREEVTQFWRALDVAGDVPFEIEYWGVGFGDYMPEVERAEELEVVAVPTFAVYRDGEEMGRVVERSEKGIVVDLLDLLTGKREGQISATRGN